jgi:hypothetical protein
VSIGQVLLAFRRGTAPQLKNAICVRNVNL